MIEVGAKYVAKAMERVCQSLGRGLPTKYWYMIKYMAWKDQRRGRVSYYDGKREN